MSNHRRYSEVFLLRLYLRLKVTHAAGIMNEINQGVDMVKIFQTLLLCVLISGCVTYAQTEALPSGAKTEFTYDYDVPVTDKVELWKRARDYFAGVYGDSRSVFRVMDQDDGTIIGKGSASWLIGNPPYTVACSTDYHIRFAAKDNKARLQLSIINGVPVASSCTGWPLPTKVGYQEIVASFSSLSNALESALNGGGASNDFKDF